MGIDVKITLENEHSILALIRKLRKVWRQRSMVNAMDESLEKLQEDAKLYAPVFRGDLRDSIMTQSQEMGDTELEGSVYSDSPYAPAQERGVPAGYWMNMDNMSEWVEVNWGESSFLPPGFELAIWLHANGIKAKWFFERAIEENEMDIVRKFSKNLEIVITSKDL